MPVFTDRRQARRAHTGERVLGTTAPPSRTARSDLPDLNRADHSIAAFSLTCSEAMNRARTVHREFRRA